MGKRKRQGFRSRHKHNKIHQLFRGPRSQHSPGALFDLWDGCPSPIFAYLDAASIVAFGRTCTQAAVSLKDYSRHMLLQVIHARRPECAPETLRAVVKPENSLFCLALCDQNVACSRCNDYVLSFEPAVAKRAFQLQVQGAAHGGAPLCDRCGAEVGIEAYALDHLDKTIAERILTHGPLTMTMGITAVLLHVPGEGAVQGPLLVQRYFPNISFQAYLERSECFKVSLNHKGRPMIQLKEEVKAVYGCDG